jgi:hypothetical protein
MTHLNLRPETLKLLQENKNIGIVNDFPIVQEIIASIDK